MIDDTVTLTRRDVPAGIFTLVELIESEKSGGEDGTVRASTLELERLL